MDNTTLIIVVLALIAVGMLVVFRRSLKISLKGFGISFAAAGSNKDSGGRLHSDGTRSVPGEAGSTVTASGERSAAIGGNFKGQIVTGDRASVRGDRTD
jgi:hypothetical protein